MQLSIYILLGNYTEPVSSAPNKKSPAKDGDGGCCCIKNLLVVRWFKVSGGNKHVDLIQRRCPQITIPQ